MPELIATARKAVKENVLDEALTNMYLSIGLQIGEDEIYLSGRSVEESKDTQRRRQILTDLLTILTREDY